jgi:hypothetical protein
MLGLASSVRVDGFGFTPLAAESYKRVEISATNLEDYGEYFDSARGVWLACAKTVVGEYIRGRTVDGYGVPVRLALGVYFVYRDRPTMQRALERYQEVRDDLARRIELLTRKSKYKFVRKIFNSRRIEILTKQLQRQERVIQELAEQVRLCAESL